jgi:hypothetical protein
VEIDGIFDGKNYWFFKRRLRHFYFMQSQQVAPSSFERQLVFVAISRHLRI